MTHLRDGEVDCWLIWGIERLIIGSFERYRRLLLAHRSHREVDYWRFWMMEWKIVESSGCWKSWLLTLPDDGEGNVDSSELCKSWLLTLLDVGVEDCWLFWMMGKAHCWLFQEVECGLFCMIERMNVTSSGLTKRLIADPSVICMTTEYIIPW